ncbi:MAG: UDP-3-O-(3-hydroxymyristoyl)glucosamine N-acyltransferase [Bacteroidota bacterium]
MVQLSQIVDFLAKQDSLILQHGTIALSQEITGPRNGDDANEHQFTFFNAKAGDLVYSKIVTSKAALMIIENTIDVTKCNFPSTVFVVQVPDAKKTMMEVAQTFFVPLITASIAPSATISDSATIGVNCSIASGVVIEEGVEIGTNCCIEPNVFIQANTLIGNNVHIKANAVIGGNGFGYVQDANKVYQHVPHFGRVIIEDDVHIGANTCIDRGSLSDTILRKGVKIDNLVHIAHNVEIGENSLVIANSMIAGSVRIGKNCWIAPSASIKNGLTIGDNVVVGLASLVLKSVEENTTVAGVPAKTLHKK